MKYSNNMKICTNILHLDNSINKLYLDKYNNKSNITTQQK